jgi:uncharacterized membrane protein YedE/YeeE
VIETLSQPWPWYVAGPLIGLTVTLLLLVGGKSFGVSSSLRHVCAATVPGKSSFLRYDWYRTGLWNLLFVAGMILGGVLAGAFLSTDQPVAISEATQADLAELGLASESGLLPSEIYSLAALGTPAGFLILVGGGFLVGFGARYAGGCTSGHAITGLANLQLPSLVAVLGFFAGGLIATHFLLPLILGG